jgi:hypothetical protein
VRRREDDGSPYWWGWASPLEPVWFWHVMADGTWLCRCAHSKWTRELTRTGPYPKGRKWSIICLDCWKLRLRYRPSRILRYPRRHG